MRRKFYDCAEAASIARELGTPEAIRRSRAIELMRNNVPLPVVQNIMGHSTPNLAAVQITDRTELCSILTEKSRKMLSIEKGDAVWAVNSMLLRPLSMLTEIRTGQVSLTLRIAIRPVTDR